MRKKFLKPPVSEDATGNRRRTGFEIEFGNVTVAETAHALQRALGGDLEELNPFVMQLEGLAIGRLRIERDTELLNNVNYRDALKKLNIDFDAGTLAREIEQGIDQISSTLIPCEIVTDPLAFEDFPVLERIVEVLEGLDASGTGDSPLNAFGVHINPSAPELSAGVIRNYLQAFLLLYDWIIRDSGTDFSRRYFTRFIDPFPRKYQEKVLTIDYAPDSATLIRDYTADNPTRNRALDLLPLLCEIDENAVLEAIKSSERRLVKKRPAFHYRLPDCRIGETGWTIATEWNRWWYVESVACTDTLRQQLIRDWREFNSSIQFPFSDDWAKHVARALATV